jgi:hypothetical protein
MKRGNSGGSPPILLLKKDSAKKDPAISAGFWRREVWRGDCLGLFSVSTHLYGGGAPSV